MSYYLMFNVIADICDGFDNQMTPNQIKKDYTLKLYAVSALSTRG